MDKEAEFSLLHISDLHFSEGTDLSNPAHTHSIKHLVGLEKAVRDLEETDFIVVSGDISNLGDRQSLINASGYLFDTIPIGEGRFTGLNMPHQKFGVVPGNHDAWNAKKSGSLLDRRQKSLEHFNFAFTDHKIPPDSGSYYRWLEKDGAGIYIVFADSCFLGDTEKHHDSAFGTIRYDQAVAKGKLSVEQTEWLLEWHDKGMKGMLRKNDGRDGNIDKELFAQSLKILVMHHYLFEPPGHSSDYFMRVSHRDVVFRNIAMADFDLMLCGHKHILSFDVHSYGQYFDGRAMNRYLINCFRRLIGLYSLPFKLKDSNGKFWSKPLSFLSEVLVKLVRKRKPSSNATKIADDVIEILKSGLENPSELERNVKNFLYKNGLSGAEIINRDELKEIRKRISIGLSIQERKKLKVVSKRLLGLSKTLKSKPFIQAMSGSSAKSSDRERTRSFNIYDLARKTNGWQIKAKQFQWDYSINEFDLNNAIETEHFVNKRAHI
ncbi:MAG: metallophosphoesterase [Acidobacteriota bacterium]|nr:metallophosphoesterase [Acidobacteriota bacterium]